jgi:hypothetical protein
MGGEGLRQFGTDGRCAAGRNYCVVGRAIGLVGGAKVGSFFVAGDFSAGCKLFVIVKFGIWFEMPGR